MNHNITYASWEQELRDLITSMPDQEGCPCIWYDSEYDRLTVILRHNNYRSFDPHYILPGVEVLLLNYLRSGEEPFTGIVFSQGVRRLVERIYQEHSGEDYASYRIRHNTKQILTTIALILHAVFDRHEPTELPIPFLDRINQMLAEESHLEIHIPL
ncbi:MAG: hypothetical protein KBB51_02420 [Candidatus Moranbacteria bacterium]|nr:hypothetical protein [Candidatus Moranbacteria bacterium]